MDANDKHLSSLSCAAAGTPLFFLRLRGIECLGRLASYEIDLTANADSDISPGMVLGQDMSLVIGETSDPLREINGMVTAFQVVEMPHGEQRKKRYRALVQPRLWLLTRGAHSRFFHEKSVLEIASSVLDDYHVDFSIRCSATYAKLHHCTQYRESDFDFLSRLMEREGVYYFIEHKDGKHTLVLTDSPEAHTPIPGKSTIAYARARDIEECVYVWHAGGLIQTGHYEVNAYDFEKPTASLQQGMLSRAARPTVHDAPVYTVQEHLSGYFEATDTEHYAKVGLEIRQARNSCITGRSNAIKMHTGSLFTLEDHPVDKHNREYLITETRFTLLNGEQTAGFFDIEEGDLFDCEFTTVPHDVKYRAERITPLPRVSGVQTAVVVGPDGEEIHTDEYGRIKVQFHWEQLSPPESAARLDRCWARVVQNWAGKNWGALTLPRIGQEVLVDFIEGDPDYPIVIGAVYNAFTMPPFKLPANANVSTNRSNSTKGGGGFNEIRYDDTKGSEQLFMHAEKDHETYVKNNQLTHVLGSRHDQVDGDELREIGGTVHVTVKGNQRSAITGDVSQKISGSRREEIAGLVSLKISNDRRVAVESESLQVNGDQWEAVTGNSMLKVSKDRNVEVTGDASLKIGGDRKEKVVGDASLKVDGNQRDEVAGDASLKVDGALGESVGTNWAITSGANVYIKAGVNLVLEAGAGITLKVGGAFIALTPASIAMAGEPIMLNSGGSAGSGSGPSISSPSAPLAPIEPVAPYEPTAPTAPTAADDGTKRIK